MANLMEGDIENLDIGEAPPVGWTGLYPGAMAKMMGVV